MVDFRTTSHERQTTSYDSLVIAQTLSVRKNYVFRTNDRHESTTTISNFVQILCPILEYLRRATINEHKPVVNVKYVLR